MPSGVLVVCIYMLPLSTGQSLGKNAVAQGANGGGAKYPSYAQAREIYRRTGARLDRTERLANSLGHLAGVLTTLSVIRGTDMKARRPFAMLHLHLHGTPSPLAQGLATAKSHSGPGWLAQWGGTWLGERCPSVLIRLRGCAPRCSWRCSPGGARRTARSCWRRTCCARAACPTTGGPPPSTPPCSSTARCAPAAASTCRPAWRAQVLFAGFQGLGFRLLVLRGHCSAVPVPIPR